MEGLSLDSCAFVVAHGDDRSDDQLQADLLNLKLHGVGIGSVLRSHCRSCELARCFWEVDLECEALSMHLH